MYEVEIEKLNDFQKRLTELQGVPEHRGAEGERAALEEQMSAQDFWDDMEKAQVTVKALKGFDEGIGESPG